MRRSPVFLLGVALVILGAIFLWNQPSKNSTAGINSTVDTIVPDLGIDTHTPQISDSKSNISNPQVVGRKSYQTGITKDNRIQISADGKTSLLEGQQIAEQLHSPNTSTEQDLENIEQLLSLYRLSFQSNPVAGDNQMVMDALMGENPQGLVIFPPTHPDLDATGQLLDRWKTPYFFHALSGQEMEIFSAGPDKEFNTNDDVQFTTRNGNPLTGQVDEMNSQQIPQ